MWFQRPKDIVRKLLSGDLDLGIVGLDTVSEFGQVRVLVCNVLAFCWNATVFFGLTSELVVFHYFEYKLYFAELATIMKKSKQFKILLISIVIFFPPQGNEDLIVVHEALEYGDCRLSLAVSFSFLDFHQH